ncbi:NAD-dependent epimerase/dehydratase family protein, partial [uncultured Dubosiella sp.]|uniref:NAD-dependent epimerase/dehydratase family protein n=1 Tax=uncultured Dubosiella sp. TaxID=1937011 RepID=UPI00272D03D2
MKTILVTGANGYIASYIAAVNQTKFNWIKMTRKDADLSDPDAVERFVRSQDCLCIARNLLNS